MTHTGATCFNSHVRVEVRNMIDSTTVNHIRVTQGMYMKASG